MNEKRPCRSLGPPPERASDLDGFPRDTLDTETDLWRVVRKGRGPWWFGSSMKGRFDLPEPHGTCYVAVDPLSALLETVGPERRGGAVSARFFEDRRIRRLHLPRSRSVADLRSRKAVGYGVTAEIGTIVPYELPQSWARKLHEAGAEGLGYWLRHDPARSEGYSLFDRHGERRHWKRGRERAISRKLLRELHEECGIEVLEIPRSDQLTVLDEE